MITVKIASSEYDKTLSDLGKFVLNQFADEALKKHLAKNPFDVFSLDNPTPELYVWAFSYCNNTNKSKFCCKRII